METVTCSTCPACGYIFKADPVRVTESTAPATEALIDGVRTFAEISELVRTALTTRARTSSEFGDYVWVGLSDLTTTTVVYYADPSGDLWQCDYSITTAGQVTLGEPMKVVRTYAPAPAEADPMAAVESHDRVVDGRIVEALADDADGNRVFRVRIIAYGDSKNGRRYPEAVLREAVGLYEGAKAYDHHRSTEELTSGTIRGLIGTFREAAAETDGIYADLHLLPGAAHAAEALDASLAAQGQGLSPLVGLSHDVHAHFRTVIDGGRRLAEATAITKVNSADVVADPAAGGQATRVLAGGIDPIDPAGAMPAVSTQEADVPVTAADVLAALSSATGEQLAAAGLARTSTTESAPTAPTTEAAPAAGPATHARESFLGKMLIRAKVEDAGLPASVVEAVAGTLGEQITESDVDAQIAAIKAGLGIVERAGLAPTVTTQVTQESHDKKVAGLDAMFAGDYSKGYRSFKEAFIDITGRRPKAFDEDFNRTILRESLVPYDSAARASESMSLGASSWNVVMGDSITRRMVAEYAQPSLQSWRAVVSSIVPAADFRTQRIERVGGYGTLPAVNEGAPYQPLTSPTDEEATYAITKRGGTEDITLEMIANDDLRAIQKIPSKLGLAAAQTLFRFVWDFFDDNLTATYDSTAWFHNNHNNTNTDALSQANLSKARRLMRAQAAYGDSANILSLVPKFLIVCNTLEELAFQLCTSAVAIPSTPAGPTDTPNLHQGITPIVVDYWSSTTQWFTVADPSQCPTLELGFYQGREEPELFTQADPSVGSVFNADKMTLKVRHTYSGAILDHRGAYRGNA